MTQILKRLLQLVLFICGGIVGVYASSPFYGIFLPVQPIFFVISTVAVITAVALLWLVGRWIISGKIPQ